MRGPSGNRDARAAIRRSPFPIPRNEELVGYLDHKRPSAGARLSASENMQVYSARRYLCRVPAARAACRHLPHAGSMIMQTTPIAVNVGTAVTAAVFVTAVSALPLLYRHCRRHQSPMGEG